MEEGSNTSQNFRVGALTKSFCSLLALEKAMAHEPVCEQNASILSLTDTCWQTNALAFVCLKMTQYSAEPMPEKFCGAFSKATLS